MSVKSSQLHGFLLSQNRNNFIHVGVSTAWLCDCPHQLSPLYIAEQVYDKSPVLYQDTVMYDGSITSQTIENATTIDCQNNLQHVIALDIYTNQHLFLTQKPIKRIHQFPLKTNKSRVLSSQTTLQLMKMV